MLQVSNIHVALLDCNFMCIWVTPFGINTSKYALDHGLISNAWWLIGSLRC